MAALLYLAAGWWLSEKIILHTEESISNRYKVARVLDFEDRLLSPTSWIFTKSEWEEKSMYTNALLFESGRQYEMALGASLHLVMASIAFFLLCFLFYFGSRQFTKMMALSLVALSIIFLYVGIYSPMLEIAAFNVDLTIPLIIEMSEIPLVADIPYLGDETIDWSKVFEGRTYYYYQSKTIAQLIAILFKDNNVLVGTAILCFSIVIPVIKLFITVSIIFSERLRRTNWLTNFIAWIGKYSMADVFVASMFLAFLSFQNMNSGVDTESNTMMGLYFFFTYVVLSIASTLLMKRIITKGTQDGPVRVGVKNWQ